MAEGALPPVVVELLAKTKEFKTQMAEAGGEFKKFEDEGKGRLKGVSQFGKAALLGVGTAAIGIGVLAVKSAMELQESLAHIQGNASITTKAANDIGTAFLSTWGKSTFSANQMAAAFAPVSGVVKQLSGGALTAKNSLAFMSGATDLAEASGQNLDSTTQDLSSTMLAFGLTTKQSGDASNVLFNISRTTGIGLDELTQAVVRLHGRLGIAAPSLSDTGALMVDLARHGISGSRGVMVVQTALGTLLGGAKPVNKELSSLGVHIFNASGKFVGMKAVLGQLQPKLAGLTDQQRLLAEKTLFGASAAIAMNNTVMAGAGAYQQATAAVNAHNAVQHAAYLAAHTLSGQMKTLTASVGDLVTMFGQKLIPIVQGVVTWLEKHKAIAEVLAGVIGGALVVAIATYVGGLVAGAASSVASFAVMIGGWLGYSTAVVEGSTEAEASSVSAFATMIGAGLAWAAGVVSMAATAVVGWLGSMATMVASAASWAVSVLVSAATAAAGWLASLGAMVVTAVTSAAAMILPFLPLIIAVAAVGIAAYELYKHWHQVWAWIKRIIHDAMTFVKSHLTLIVGALALPLVPLLYLWNHWRQVWNGIKQLVHDVWVNVLQPIWDLIKTGLADVGTVVSALGTVWSSIWSAVQSAVSAAWHFVSPVWDVVKSGLTAIGSVLSTVGGVWSSVWNGIQSAVQTVWSILQPIFSSISGAVSTIASGIGSVMKLAGGIGKGIGAVLHHIPFLAEGGVVTKPTIAMIGESGPEMVVPMRHVNKSAVAPLPRSAGSLAMMGSSSYAGSSSSSSVSSAPVINVYGATSEELLRGVSTALQEHSAELARTLRAM